MAHHQRWPIIPLNRRGFFFGGGGGDLVFVELPRRTVWPFFFPSTYSNQVTFEVAPFDVDTRKGLEKWMEPREKNNSEKNARPAWTFVIFFTYQRPGRALPAFIIFQFDRAKINWVPYLLHFFLFVATSGCVDLSRKERKNQPRKSPPWNNKRQRNPVTPRRRNDEPWSASDWEDFAHNRLPLNGIPRSDGMSRCRDPFPSPFKKQFKENPFAENTSNCQSFDTGLNDLDLWTSAIQWDPSPPENNNSTENLRKNGRWK